MVAGAADIFRYYAGWSTKIYGETNPSDPGVLQLHPARTGRRLRPDHSLELPPAMARGKLAPALACGNVVVLKPAEQTPLTALRLAS